MKGTKMSISTTKATIMGKTTIEEILNRIKNETYKTEIENLRIIVNKSGKNTLEYKSAKERLVGFTPSGIFNRKRNKESFDSNSYSQILVLDIDELKDNEHVENVKTIVKKIENTLSVFISPSGRGCKILVKVNSSPEKHKEVYEKLMFFYNTHLALSNAKCDDKCSDISRFHYFSHDPDIYINWDSQIFTPQLEANKQKIMEVFGNNSDSIKSSEQLTQKKLVFNEGRNNYIHLLACNLNRYEVAENDALNYIVSEYKEAGFTEKEIVATVKGVYKRNKNEFGRFLKTKSDPKKEYDYKKIREDLEISNVKLELDSYFSLLFQSCENEEDMLNYLLDNFTEISQVFKDKILSYFSMEIRENRNFDTSIFSENADPIISSTYQTLYDNEILPSDDRKRRILIADFKAECLNEFHYLLLTKQPFLTKVKISDSFKELNQISELAKNQIKISKALLEDYSDNPL